MKTVVNQLSRRKYFSDSQHHGRGQIGCNRSDRQSFLVGKRAQDTACRISYHSMDYGDQSVLTPLGCLVSQNSIGISVVQTSLVQRKILSKVFRIKDMIMRVLKLIPVSVITDLFLVLLTQGLIFYAVSSASAQMLTGVNSISFFLKRHKL